MKAEERARCFLEGDFLLHADMLQCLRRKSADILEADGEGVLLFERRGEVYMMSASSPAFARNLVALLPPGTDCVTVHQDFFLEPVQARFGPLRTMVCTNVVYLGRENLKVPDCPAMIRPLTEEYTDWVAAHYSLFSLAPLPYLRSRIREGAILGAFIGDRPCGFAGTHAEGSIGLLEVLPECRRMGIAAALQASVANAVLAEGGIPYGQVKEGNEASFRLQKKLGFIPAGSNTFWMTK
ncbi:GNAT family N-acetyltransferase [Papillibacter cinnamivorans]|uniref:Acetyltransferase (GNAT) domain-containing protein n=1 Tax=Papillibacter cinnamivorans DSM 12816 TaxID=1122930 RepID=A0A1W2A5D3_9FIRM|nr:GNAT family N-acetyltransferase [Papillibacter cinnamivorans]SMC55498.1 Acetyltransferase (GNAT) domain-containing protein [Papillibacter cinnamivorans DSM 12816]